MSVSGLRLFWDSPHNEQSTHLKSINKSKRELKKDIIALLERQNTKNPSKTQTK